MEIIEHDLDGRLYKAIREGDNVIVMGPPEGLVDELGLPEPFATSLHNILYRRGVLSYADATKNPNNVLGAYQEALRLDVQKLIEGFFKYGQEVRNE